MSDIWVILHADMYPFLFRKSNAGKTFSIISEWHASLTISTFDSLAFNGINCCSLSSINSPFSIISFALIIIAILRSFGIFKEDKNSSEEKAQDPLNPLLL